jgi:hypothetical protein
LNSLKGKVAISVIQDMRDASKTGGAVGQVTEKEWPILMNKIASLEQAQSAEQVRERLDDLVKYSEDVKTRIRHIYNRSYGGGASTEVSPDATPKPFGGTGFSQPFGGTGFSAPIPSTKWQGYSAREIK